MPYLFIDSVSRYLSRSPPREQHCHATAAIASAPSVRPWSKIGVTRGYSATCLLACSHFVGFEELSTERSAATRLLSSRAFQVALTAVQAASHLRVWNSIFSQSNSCQIRSRIQIFHHRWQTFSGNSSKKRLQLFPRTELEANTHLCMLSLLQPSL